LQKEGVIAISVLYWPISVAECPASREISVYVIAPISTVNTVYIYSVFYLWWIIVISNYVIMLKENY